MNSSCTGLHIHIQFEFDNNSNSTISRNMRNQRTWQGRAQQLWHPGLEGHRLQSQNKRKCSHVVAFKKSGRKVQRDFISLRPTWVIRRHWCSRFGFVTVLWTPKRAWWSAVRVQDVLKIDRRVTRNWQNSKTFYADFWFNCHRIVSSTRGQRHTIRVWRSLLPHLFDSENWF